MPEEVVSPSHDDGHLQRVDPAALLGAAVAAVLTITLAEGAWWWLDVIIGITLGFVLFAYAPTLSAQPKLARRQAAAFGGVAGLCVVLVFGYPLQWALQSQHRPGCAQQVSQEFAQEPPSRQEGLIKECVAGYATEVLIPGVWAAGAISIGTLHFFRRTRPSPPQDGAARSEEGSASS